MREGKPITLSLRDRRGLETLVAKREKEGDMLTPLTLAARSRWF